MPGEKQLLRVTGAAPPLMAKRNGKCHRLRAEKTSCCQARYFAQVSLTTFTPETCKSLCCFPAVSFFS